MPHAKNRKNFKRRLLRAVLLPLILLTALALFFLWQINRLVAATAEVERIDRTIAATHDTQRLLVDMETGMRGYLITGDREFLEPYHAGGRDFESSFANLAASASDAPQRARLEEVRALHSRWSVYARDLIALRDAGGDYAARVGEGVGKSLTDATRAQMSAFIATEENVRDERTASTQHTTRLATFGALASTLLLGGALAFFARRDLVSLSDSYAGALVSEQQGRERLRVTLASIGDAVVATDDAGRVTFMNPVAEELTKWTEAEASGRASEEIFRIINEDTREKVESPVARVLREGVIVGLANHTKLIARDNTEVFIDDSGAPIKDAKGHILGAVLVFRDIGERRAAEAERERLRAEQERMREEQAQLHAEQAVMLGEQARLQNERLKLQDELVSAQAARLAELSTPLIPVTNEIVVMPLIGTIDSERAGQVLDALSKGVAESGARFAIIDITGVRTVDSHVAQVLVNAARAVRLLGAEAIFTGTGARVAQTIVSLGIDFAGLTTRSTLQRGINYALARLSDGDAADAADTRTGALGGDGNNDNAPTFKM